MADRSNVVQFYDNPHLICKINICLYNPHLIRKINTCLYHTVSQPLLLAFYTLDNICSSLSKVCDVQSLWYEY